MVYFLAGGKPRQTVPTRLLWRLAVEGSGCRSGSARNATQCRRSRRDALAAAARRRRAARRFRSTSGCASGCCLCPRSRKRSDTRGSSAGSTSCRADQRLVFFKLITGELRVGVSRLQVVKALAEVAGVEESRMAQRMIGYAQARRTPAPEDFEALIAEVAHAEAQALDAGRPYPFYLAQSWQRPVAEMQETLGPPSNWIVEWKFDGIRAQLLRRGEGWRLWSRGEELISDSLSRPRAAGAGASCGVALDGELVVMVPPESDASPDSLQGLAPFASLQQRLGRKVVSEKTMRELPVAFIAYDLLELDGRDMRGEPQRERRAALERLVQRASSPTAQRERLPLAREPDGRRRRHGRRWRCPRAARALGREGLMLKAREGAYGVGRRKGDDRMDVWWKWKLDPMSVDAVLIYAQRGHGRRSGVYSDYTFAVWSAGEDAREPRTRAFRQGLFGPLATPRCARWTRSSAARRSRPSGRCAA